MNYAVGTKLVMKQQDSPFTPTDKVLTVYEHNLYTYRVGSSKYNSTVYFEHELDSYFKVYSDTDKLKKFIKKD